LLGIIGSAAQRGTNCAYGVGRTSPGKSLRLIRLAGEPALPTPFMSIRGSYPTELAQTYPGHGAPCWLERSEAVVNTHYRMILDEHYQYATGFDRAGETG